MSKELEQLLEGLESLVIIHKKVELPVWRHTKPMAGKLRKEFNKQIELKEQYRFDANFEREINLENKLKLDEIREIVDYVLVPYTHNSDKYLDVFELANAIKEVLDK